MTDVNINADPGKAVRRKKAKRILVKVLVGIAITVCVVLILFVSYYVLKFLFTLAILVLAWLRPGRWR